MYIHMYMYIYIYICTYDNYIRTCDFMYRGAKGVPRKGA